MKKCLLIYESLTGNTEVMAESIAQGIRRAGGEVEMKEMFHTAANELEDADCFLLGSSTWGDGDLPDGALDFYEEMHSLRLEGKKAAVFGSCDSSYEDTYGMAVDIFEQKLKSLGVDLILEGRKVELCPSSKDAEECREFGELFFKNACNLV